MVRVYKESKDFENDATEVGVDAYMISFIDCRDNVAQAYPELDLRGIIADGANLEEGEGAEGVAVEEKNTMLPKNRLLFSRRRLRVSFFFFYFVSFLGFLV